MFGFRASAGERVRRSTHKWAQSIGVPVATGLPMLTETAPVRTADAVARRMLCLYATAATAFGCAPATAHSWLEHEGVLDALMPAEAAYIAADSRDQAFADSSIESCWALTWALGMYPSFDVAASAAPDDLITKMPSMLSPGSGRAVVSAARLISDDQLLAALDCAYYYHWARVERMLHAVPTAAPSLATIESRRQSFEWLFVLESWDEIVLDT